jgi:hypothetical protein
MSEEWGPWIEHDGLGFPERLICVTVEVEAVDCFGEDQGQIGMAKNPRAEALCAWDWSYYRKFNSTGDYNFSKVIRYRIRKPRGLTILEGILENLPEKVDA